MGCMTGTAPLSQPLEQQHEPRLSYVIARLERAVRQAINERVRPHGLTALQYTTLSVLGARGELSNAQLARRSYMTPQAMSEVIEALERKGLIERSPHPSHRRVLPAALTDDGRRVLAACDEAVGEFEQTMTAALSAAERDGLQRALKACVRTLGAGFPQA
jgi:DNA-binding MarR family transcriptional regulator